MARTAMAAVHDGRGTTLDIREVWVADPGPGEVLVRMGASGVCGSDRHVIDGEWHLPTPTVLGHEGAGTVEAVGPGVTDVAPGDSVILSWYYPCRRCRACAAGKAWACTGTRSGECLLPDGTTRLSDERGVVYPYLAVGTMSEYAVVPESAAVRVPSELPMDVASLIGCSITTGVGAVTNNARVPAGASAVVVGCGGVGLAVVMGLVLAGAHPIIAVDTSEEKLAAARSFGATHTVQAGPGTDVAAAVADLTGGGADYAFEVIGRVETIETLPSLLATAGVGVLVGLPPEGARAGIDVLELAEAGKTLIGSNYGGAVPGLDFPRLAGLYLAGRLPLDSLISHRIRLEEVNEAFAAMRAGTRTRSVIVFD
ncbi:S-(hydroxymethyl)glutathione dehydrogenase / alcohol dehydrogenase [Thermomonospora echinospora]|uniref:S-(Hydroxymethyl)glutathione dehydrogenase / alcohol dehydrogenase n=1 Tax=Thermomonospora echinospora TaxID=1992 RepID=A0A1H6EAX3_9ACTN|nr:alcohol dehydrogenase catalytic domain-containing protein [Thermomonospora echinospora]SEG94391.1 S-(hydroxymethyl)glutathione dehydrogenase / alcohol dehydrogenase [Thermomonospora echinospora]